MTTNAATADTTTEAASTAASATSGTDAAAVAAAAAAAAAAEAAASGSGAAAIAVPEKYDLKVPDGSNADAGLVERATAIAREWGLSNEVAQKLLDREVARTAETTTATTAAVDAAKAEQLTALQPGGAVWKEQETQWQTQSLADAEIGGSPEKLKASVDLAMKVVNKFATDDTKKFFNDTGLGNHPELVRVFSRIGRQMAEASLALPSTLTGGEMTTEQRLNRLYPTMAPKS